MVQGPFPIQDDESAELTDRGSSERPTSRLRWLVIIVLAVLLFVLAWSFGPPDWLSDDEPEADTAARHGVALVAAVSRSSPR